MTGKTNFYFCEGCGKRITEQEIDEGKARNKKLKGVFCTTCAVGVTTMDDLPLSNREAKNLLGKPEATATPAPAKKRSSSGHRRPGRRPTSAHDLPKAQKRIPSGRSAAVNAVGQPTSGKWMVLAGAGALILIAAMAGLMSGPSEVRLQPKNKEVAVANGASTGTLSQGEEKIAPAATTAPTDLPDSQDARVAVTPEPATQERDSQAKEANGEPAVQPVVGETSKPEPSQAIAAGEAGPNPKADTKANGGATEQAQPPAKEEPAPTPKAAEPPKPSKEELARRAERATKKLVNDVMARLAKGDRTGALAEIKSAEGKPEFATRREVLIAERNAVGWLEELDAAARKGVVLLQDGRPFALQFGKKQVEVGKEKADRVEGFKDDVIKLVHQEKQVNFPVNVEFRELSQATVTALAGLVMGKEADGALKLAWHGLVGALGFDGHPREALRQMTEARDTLRLAIEKSTDAKGDVLAFMRDRLAWANNHLKWIDMATAWEAALLLVKEEKWEEAQEGLVSWNKTFKGTPYHTKKQDEFAGVMKRVRAEVKSIMVDKARSHARLAAHFTFDDEKSEYYAKETPGIKATWMGEYVSNARFGGGIRCKGMGKGKPSPGIRLQFPKKLFAHGGTIEFWVKGGAHYRGVLVNVADISGMCFSVGNAGSLRENGPPTRRWCHIGVVFGEGQWMLYANGRVIRKKSGDFDWKRVRNVYFGSNRATYSTSYPDSIEGYLDNIRVWQGPVKVFDLTKP